MQKKHCGRSQPSNSRCKIKECVQHKTAQRMTACRSVIHPFLSFSPSLLLSSLLLSFSPSLSSHTLLSSVPRQKAPKLIQTGKSLWPFSGIRGSFAGSWLFWAGIGSQKKKTVGNHFPPHGTILAKMITTLIPGRRNL